MRKAKSVQIERGHAGVQKKTFRMQIINILFKHWD